MESDNETGSESESERSKDLPELESDTDTDTDTENDDSETENENSDTEYGFMHYCLSCEAYYDGYAQCCHEMQHVIYKVNMETREIIGEL